jgi:uncharacterized membrane protein
VFEWLFKYTRAEYARGELLLSSDWPMAWWYAALVIGALALAALAWSRGRALGWARLGVIVALQWTMLALVLLELWQPALLLKTLRAGENAIALLLDDSASMALRDPQLSRLSQAQAALADPALGILTSEFKPRRYRFSGTADSIASFADVQPTGRATAIGDSVSQVLRSLQSTPLGAVVLVSDGAENAGVLDAEQLAAIASYGVPVHVIGVGRETMSEDLELQDILVPEKTLPGTTLAARVGIRHDGGGVARIKAYDGQHYLASHDVTLPADATVTNAFLNFELADSGYRELRFSVDPKAGETTLPNNERARVVQVAGRKANVLYVEGEPRWELKFMRRALEHDSGVRLMSWLHTSPNGYYRQGIDVADELKAGFPTERPALFKYDAIIMGSVAAAAFRPAQLQLLREFVSERGGSLLMLAGPNGLGDGGWGETAVGKLLPAQLPAGKHSFQRAQAEVLLTARGRRSTTVKFADDVASNEKLWGELPKVADYQTLGALRPAAVALLNLRVADREQPLLVTQPFGRGHSWILASGGTWRWQMLLPLADQRHEQFWRQLLRGLVADVPEAFAVQARAVGDKLVVRVDAHDESFAPLRDVAIAATASLGNQSTEIPLQPLAGQPGAYRGEANMPGSGTYFVDAVAQRSGKLVGKGRTVVQFGNADAESFGLRQNRALLTQLARATGGAYWEPTKLAGLPDAVRASAAGVTRQELKSVWDAPIAFLTLALLKSAEWLLRRRWGVV